jgi:hypothetical protein
MVKIKDFVTWKLKKFCSLSHVRIRCTSVVVLSCVCLVYCSWLVAEDCGKYNIAI